MITALNNAAINNVGLGATTISQCSRRLLFIQKSKLRFRNMERYVYKDL